MKNEIEKYSIAIIPSDEIVNQFKTFKDLLAENIGSYKSRNSIAHISIKEFYGNSQDLALVKKQLERTCNTMKPFEVSLTTFNSYPNSKAFFVAPDTFSKELLKQVMKQIQKAVTVKSDSISSDPHISIGRGLKNLEQAHVLFNFPIDLKFECNGVSIRKYNPEIGQYEVNETFNFKSEPNQEPQQMSLFE